MESLSFFTYMQAPGGARLELFDYKGKSPEHEKPESEIGLRHIAFEVKDVSMHEKELRARGVKITLPTSDLDNLNSSVLLFTDPNDVTVEFCEKL
jgi:catechol 2,3-dioxygenase-like lactoylglutathione lyase family enzyme